MSAMNAAVHTAKITNRHQSHIPSLHHHRPILLSRPLSSLSFRDPYPPPSRLYASSSSSPNPKKVPKAISSSDSSPPQSPFPYLKTAVIGAVAAAALFFSRFYLLGKPVVAAPIRTPPVVDTQTDGVPEEEKERDIEEHLASHPNDVDALRSLMEIKIKNRKVPEAVSIIDRLIELEPEEVEWKLMKSHLYVHIGEVELAKVGFNELISKDPLRVEAYHGLVMAASQDDSTEELKGIEKKIEEGIKLAKKENKKNELRDFKLLIAQVRVIEGRYDDALKVYQELVNEEPRDFRPYLCQGIIYTLLRKNNEAEKNFEKYRRLVPKGHPYASYFDDNMIATKVFAEKVERERAASKK